jgi:hypothetical protein
MLLQLAVTALSGGLAGAIAAFILGVMRQRWDDRRDQVEKFAAARFLLVLQRSVLLNLWHQELAPRRDDPRRQYTLRTLLVDPPQETLEVRPLAFLFRLEQSDLLSALINAENHYRAVVGMLQARNELHNAFQDKLETAQRERGGMGSLEELDRIAGPRIALPLKAMTDDLYVRTKDALEENRKASELAANRFREMYPHASLFGVEDLPPRTDSGTSPAGPSAQT